MLQRQALASKPQPAIYCCVLLDAFLQLAKPQFNSETKQAQALLACRASWRLTGDPC